MTGLMLIVETPRGGDAGNCFLCSRNDVGELEIARVAAAASHTEVGSTYISVSRQVTQRLSNGAIREGFERMILLGLDVKELRPEQIGQVKDRLKAFFPSLEALVESMHCSSDRQSMVVTSQDLQDWLDNAEFKHLPVSRLSHSHTAAQAVSPYHALYKWLPIGTVCLLLCLVLLWMFLGRQGRTPDEGNIPDIPVPIINVDSNLQDLAREWECTPEAVVRSLLRASNWDRRREADDLTLLAGQTDGEVLQILKKVVSSRDVNTYCASPAFENDPEFRRFVETHPSPYASKMKELRRWLYHSWERFSELKQAAANASQTLNRLVTKDKFSEMLVFIAGFETEVGLGDAFLHPETPMFDRQDVMIYRLLKEFRRRCVDVGFALDGNDGGGSVNTGDDLATFINDMRSHHKELVKELTGSRAVVTDTIAETQGSDVAETVRKAYKSFEAFLECLSKSNYQ